MSRSSHWPPQRSSTADYTRPSTLPNHALRPLPHMLSRRGKKKSRRTSTNSETGGPSMGSTMDFSTRFASNGMLGATGQFQSVPENFVASFGSSMVLPNPFQIEKTTNWPSSPSPSLGTQLPLTAAPVQPQFLTEIEQYVEQELIELHTTGDISEPLTVAEQRLEIYSHAFEMFISRLSTYQPLLSSIHKEYDSLITLLQNKVSSFEATQSELGTLKDRTVLLVNKIKADYTRRLMALQTELKVKEDKCRDMYTESRKMLHEMEGAQHREAKAKAASDENFESAKLLADVICLREKEIDSVKEQGNEMARLSVEKEELKVKVSKLMDEIQNSVQLSEHQQLQAKYDSIKSHNEELLTQLKKVNEEYAATAEVMQEQAENWQARNKNSDSRKNSNTTPRPNIKALTTNLECREYPVPLIEVGSSTAEVVGQLFSELDRLSAEAAGCEASPIPLLLKQPISESTASKDSPHGLPYFKGTAIEPEAHTDKETQALLHDFMAEHAKDWFHTGKARSAGLSLGEYMRAKYTTVKEQEAHCAGLIVALIKNKGTDRTCECLLSALQRDSHHPLTQAALTFHLQLKDCSLATS